jgi:hypothetical protein
MSDEVREIWSEEELDTALASLRSDVDTDAARLAGARAELMRVAAADEVPVVDPLVEAVPRRRLSWWMAAAAAIALVAVVVLAAQLVQDGENPPPAESGDLLEQAAANTADEPVGPGQYRYVNQHGWELFAVSSNNVMVSASRGEQSFRTWVPHDWRDDWLRRIVYCDNTFSLPDNVPIDPEDQESCFSTPQEEFGPCGAYGDSEAACTQPGRWTTPNPLFIDSLPRDPEALRSRLLTDYAAFIDNLPEGARTGFPTLPAQRVMGYAGELLRSGLAPADLRATVYRMLAKLPGLRVTDPDVSLDGRRGVGFGIVVDGIRREFVIEPSTGEFIGTRTVYLSQDQLVPVGTEFYSSVSTAVVDELGQEPG